MWMTIIEAQEPQKTIEGLISIPLVSFNFPPKAFLFNAKILLLKLSPHTQL